MSFIEYRNNNQFFLKNECFDTRKDYWVHEKWPNYDHASDWWFANRLCVGRFDAVKRVSILQAGSGGARRRRTGRLSDDYRKNCPEGGREVPVTTELRVFGDHQGDHLADRRPVWFARGSISICETWFVCSHHGTETIDRAATTRKEIFLMLIFLCLFVRPGLWILASRIDKCWKSSTLQITRYTWNLAFVFASSSFWGQTAAPFTKADLQNKTNCKWCQEVGIVVVHAFLFVWFTVSFVVVFRELVQFLSSITSGNQAIVAQYHNATRAPFQPIYNIIKHQYK